ncbi:hypothetical protein DMENIID0001_015060 [Sergentomyia squamirostris]
MEELWKENPETHEDRFSYLLGNKAYADMVFIVGKEKSEVVGHKLILSTCSMELHSHLLINNFLNIDDVPVDAFMDFLNYCYTGRIICNADKVMDILKLGYRFNMRNLVKICELKAIDMLNEKTCMEFYRNSDFLPKDSALKMNILHFIARNFRKVIEDDSMMSIFKDLPLSDFKEIQNCMQKNTSGSVEFLLFDVLMEWAKNSCEKAEIECSSENLRKSLGEVFEKIRFQLFEIGQLLEIAAKYPGLLSYTELSEYSCKFGRTSGIRTPIPESTLNDDIENPILLAGAGIDPFLSPATPSSSVFDLDTGPIESTSANEAPLS